MRRMLGFTLELLIVIALVSIVFVLAVSSWKEIEEQQAEAEVAPSRMRLDYRQDRFEIWCDTATGTRLYWVANNGLASVSGGCK